MLSGRATMASSQSCASTLSQNGPLVVRLGRRPALAMAYRLARALPPTPALLLEHGAHFLVDELLRDERRARRPAARAALPLPGHQPESGSRGRSPRPGLAAQRAVRRVARGCQE